MPWVTWPKTVYFAVQVGHRLQADVELAAAGAPGRVDVVGQPGHGDGAGGVAEMDLRRQRVAGAAGAEPGEIVPAGEGIAHLDEGVGDDAVDLQARVEFVAEQFLEVGDGFRRGGGVQGDDDALDVFLMVDAELEDGAVLILGVDGAQGEVRGEGKGGGRFFSWHSWRPAAAPELARRWWRHRGSGRAGRYRRIRASDSRARPMFPSRNSRRRW